MICVTVCDFGYDACRHALRRCEKYLHTYPDLVAEVRLDLCGLSGDDTQKLFLSSDIPLIATCRRRSRNLFAPALLSGASYVDIDGMQSDSRINEITEELKGYKAVRIFSYTDYQKTPGIEELMAYVNSAAAHNAGIVRISTNAQSIGDSERVLSLYRLQREGRLPSSVRIAAYCMGYSGTYSVLDAYSMGSPFLYCSLNDRNNLYPGMLTIDAIGKMQITGVAGELVIPGSKDMTQKAVMASLLATGRSTLSNYTPCRDTDAALSLAAKRARSVELRDGELEICGRSLKGKSDSEKSSGGYLDSFKSLLSGTSSARKSEDVVFVGESGLLARLCLPIMAQIGCQVTVTGEGRLLEREMVGCKDALEQFGASCILTSDEALPAIVCGPLTGSSVTLSTKDGTQLASGLVMALPLSKKDSVLTLEEVSNPSGLLSTVDLVRSYGIDISCSVLGDTVTLNIPGRQKYVPADVRLEGDWSAAANFIAAAAIFGSLRLSGLDSQSSQADRNILDIVRLAGADVTCSNNFIEIHRGHLVSFSFDVSRNPDLFPILAVLAAYCEGSSVISGLRSTEYRQSRRVEATCAGLVKMGVPVHIGDDDVTINGVCYARRIMENNFLKGGNMISNGDHRVAMALKIAGIHSREKVSIDDMDCVNKSYPQFKDALNSIIRTK